MDEMQGAEDEVEGSVLAYVTETEFRKQRSRSPFYNIHYHFFSVVSSFLAGV